MWPPEQQGPIVEGKPQQHAPLRLTEESLVTKCGRQDICDGQNEAQKSTNHAQRCCSLAVVEIPRGDAFHPAVGVPAVRPKLVDVACDSAVRVQQPWISSHSLAAALQSVSRWDAANDLWPHRLLVTDMEPSCSPASTCFDAAAAALTALGQQPASWYPTLDLQ